MARRVVLKNNGLSGTSTPNGYTSIGMDGTTISTQVGATNSGIGGGGASYLVYTALLSQSGENNPSISVLENTTGQTPSIVRDDIGVYLLNFTGNILVANKVALYSQNGSLLNPNMTTRIIRSTQNQIEIRSKGTGGASEDDLLSETLIEIRIYP